MLAISTTSGSGLSCRFVLEYFQFYHYFICSAKVLLLHFVSENGPILYSVMTLTYVNRVIIFGRQEIFYKSMYN